MRIHDLRHIDIVYPCHLRLCELSGVGDEEESDGEFMWGDEVCQYEGVFGWGVGGDEGED
jgi:hypothetical protein